MVNRHTDVIKFLRRKLHLKRVSVDDILFTLFRAAFCRFILVRIVVTAVIIDCSQDL